MTEDEEATEGAKERTWGRKPMKGAIGRTGVIGKPGGAGRGREEGNEATIGGIGKEGARDDKEGRVAVRGAEEEKLGADTEENEEEG